MIERTLEEVVEEAEDNEIQHMMACKVVGCKRCQDETPPLKKAKRYMEAA